MGYKKMGQEISFADLILKSSMGNNRCLEQLNKIHVKNRCQSLNCELKSDLLSTIYGSTGRS